MNEEDFENMTIKEVFEYAIEKAKANIPEVKDE